MASDQYLILASGSPRRVELLSQIRIEPQRLMPMDLDETPKRNENPRTLAGRLAREKAEAAHSIVRDDAAAPPAWILAADTVVAVGRRILPKAELEKEAYSCLNLLSGRAHWVYTGVTLIAPSGHTRSRIAETKVRFKRLSSDEIDAYVASGEWRGKAGGYGIQGIAGAFVQKLQGSYTAVVGLPLYETLQLLNGEGFVASRGWLEG
jgi:septum formation protein